MQGAVLSLDRGRLEGELQSDKNQTDGPPISLVVITLDLHEVDEPSDISFAAEWLASAYVPATFFVPSAMFGMPRYRASLRALHALGHEVGSHSHLHDDAEIDALVRGDLLRLAFLEKSKRFFEDFYGREPRAFRSPLWCALSPVALSELERLGYTVDSSVTPQRLSILSSRPFQSAWTLASRRLRYIRPKLLEVPTSTFLIPAGSPTFQTLRLSLSRGFIRLLLWEVLAFNGRMLTLQFHPDDFNPSALRRPVGRSLQWDDFWLCPKGGFGFKHHLRDTHSARISAITHAIVSLLRIYGCTTLGAVSDLVSKNGLLSPGEHEPNYRVA